MPGCVQGVCGVRAVARGARAIVTVAALMAASAPVTASADEPAAVESTSGEEVLVRGSQVGGFVSHARLEEGPREVTDAASLIEPLPGVHVRRLGADDAFATVSIRGSSSTQVAVFLAGVPLSGGADPTIDLSTLPLWPGAHARVHRSFAPASLGRGSLGGTLVIDPPSPRSSARTEVWTAAGSFGARRLRIGDVRGDVDGGLRVASGISASRADDDFRYLDENATQAAGRDVYTTRRNAGHASASGLVSAALPVRFGASSIGGLTVTGLAQARHQELPGGARFPTPLQSTDSSRLLSALELTAPISARSSVSARVWGRREELVLRDDVASLARGPSSTGYAVVALGGGAGWRTRPAEGATLEVRVDGSAERFVPGVWSDEEAPPSARRGSGGVAIDASATVASRALLSASARADAWVDASAAPTRAEYRPTGHVGVEAPIGPVVVASHGGYVARPPSFVERYGNNGAFIGNPALSSESAFTADAGARFTRRFGPLRLRAELTGFATWADDLITFNFVGGGGRAKATNIGRARLLGLEGELRASAFGVDVRVSHTGLATENQDDADCDFAFGGRCTRPPLPLRPEHDLVADLAWTRGPIRLRYGIDVVSGIRRDVSGSNVVPARTFHGAGATLRVPKLTGTSLTLDVRNLFDVRAVDVRGSNGTSRAPVGDLYDYPLPGRRVLLTACWTMDR